MADEAAGKGFSKAISGGPLGTLARLLWFLLLCLILFVIGLGKGIFFPSAVVDFLNLLRMDLIVLVLVL